MRRLAVVLLVGVAAGDHRLSRCSRRRLTLNRNLSGQAGFSMKVDAEPLVPFFMAQMQRQMQGKSGPPTARSWPPRGPRCSRRRTRRRDFEKDKRGTEQHLPPGVKLVNATFNQDGLSVSVRLYLRF